MNEDVLLSLLGVFIYFDMLVLIMGIAALCAHMRRAYPLVYGAVLIGIVIVLWVLRWTL